MSQNEINNIRKVLETLSTLLASWGFSTDDWVLTGQYADVLQGYDVKVRKGHLNVLIPRAKVSWEIDPIALEFYPPVNSEKGKQYQAFIESTGFEFDLIPHSDKAFAEQKNRTVLYALSNGHNVHLLTPYGELIILQDILSKSDEKGWGEEKGRRIYAYVAELRDVVKGKSKNPQDFERVLERYKSFGSNSLSKEELIFKFQEMPWEVWLHRRFSPFVTYLMMTHGTSAGFKTAGLDGQFPIAFYDTDDWYSTPEMFALAGEEAGRYLKQKDIFTLTRQCEEILERGRKEIHVLCASNEPPRVVFEKVLDIIKPANVYIWIAHASEAYYKPIIRKAVEPYVAPEEVEKYVGDISFPSKKNALAHMEADARSGDSVEELHKKYAWINSRGGFLPGYTLGEIEEIREKILSEPEKATVHVEIPEAILSLAREVQELVYLRTLRTDALYELYYLAQPIFERYAKEVGVDSLQNYIPYELIAGTFERVPHEYAILKHFDEVVVLRESIFSHSSEGASEIKGVIAFKGKVTGKVRIVHTSDESKQVETGDILVTNMTTPAFISAMHRAAAFVTDEGGITCHAAILARELKKPCITGTKIATKVLKDGDVVEVDAEKGTVKVVSR